jgi:hypothetical protein
VPRTLLRVKYPWSFLAQGSKLRCIKRLIRVQAVHQGWV